MPTPFRFRLLALALACASACAEQLTVLHVGDQESWLVSAQGKLRDDPTQPISFYGGIDRLAAVIERAAASAQAAGRSVLKLNAGDALLPGPRLDASRRQLAHAHADGGQDFYDAIALRRIGFDALIFGNHEFDLGSDLAARFAEVAATSYLSANLNFAATARFAALAAAGQVAPSKVVATRGGHRIGIVGVTTPLLPSLSSPAPDSLLAETPSTTLQDKVSALLPLVQAQIDALRREHGVGTVIVVSHLQSIDNDRALLVPGLTGVDLLVSGGGHELMADANDALIAGGIAPSFTSHPIHAKDRDGRPVAIVSAHFGNRYVGEVNLTIDDGDGRLRSIDGMRMLRVSGAPADADRVAGDPGIYAEAVKPVQDYLATLDREVIGRTAVALNGPTHAACETNAAVAPASTCSYTAGVRNAETGLGNLIADAMRFAGGTEIAIQNGGGIRNNLAGPGQISVGDTVNVLPFTNLVKRAPTMNAAQLKDLMEHSVAASTPNGSPQGRFAQVSGFRVDYDTRRVARTTPGSGERIRRITLDDGTRLVDEGLVVDRTRTFSFATIDFTANGGDGYPFAANGVVFENAVATVSYQEAFANYLRTPKAAGGLQRIDAADGEEITANLYGTEDPYDRHGRLVDLAIAQARPGLTLTGTARPDVIVGSAGDDVIEGAGGADTLTGGAGGDRFVYARPGDGGKTGDVITDFTPYADRLDLGRLLSRVGCRVAAGCRPFADGYLKLTDVSGGTLVSIDADGRGPAALRPLVTLKGLTARQVVPGRDFIY